MHVLHISNDFSNTKVHSNLYKQLDKMGVEQTIFNPIRVEKRNTIGRNEFDAEHTRFVYADVVKPYHRYVYHLKRQAVYHSLKKKVNLKEIDMVHAATLFSDGGVAYRIYKKYHIPYVVAVRGTDINGFLNRLPNTWASGREILRNAKVIFFISKALMDEFADHKVIQPILPEIKDKMLLVPNGIEDYFLDNVSRGPCAGHKVLYVGDFSPNKNVVRLCEAVIQLRKEEGFEDTNLTIVGGGRAVGDGVQTMIDSHPDCIKFLGPIYDKDKLCEVFRSNSVFVMPSFSETFGLVYLEALSQNLPVVYTKGQGIDGLFDETVGIGVNPASVDDIKYAIRTILATPDKYSNSSIDFEKYRWSYVAEKYLSFYKLLNGREYNAMNLLKLIKKWGGVIFRYPIYRLRHNKISVTSEIERNNMLRNCKVGKYVFVGSNGTYNNVEIGNYTCIAPSCQIGGLEHPYWETSISPKLYKDNTPRKTTHIGHDVWIAANCIIRQGITIGDGAVVGAGSFVNKDVPPYAIVFGSPAKLHKYRFNQETINKLDESHYWDFPPNKAKMILMNIKIANIETNNNVK